MRGDFDAAGMARDVLHHFQNGDESMKAQLSIGLVVLAPIFGACSHSTDTPSTTMPSGTAERQSPTRRAARSRTNDHNYETVSHENVAITAQDQSSSESDTRITQDIRQRVVDDNRLSFMSKNVTIITQDGIVTLRGSVSTESEKRAIEADAREVLGVQRIQNALEVSQ